MGSRVSKAFWIIAALVLGTAGSLQAEVYYVAPTGQDTNPGTIEKPFQTIQKGLDIVKPGDTCAVRAGTYKEAIVLKTTGKADGRITLRNHADETVTIDSGRKKSLRTNGRHEYYTIEGLHFVAEHANYEKDFDFSLDFEDGIWDGPDKKEGGNNGFILRNCVIDGAVHFYGHDIVMEGCELRGHDVWRNGVFASFMVSYGNTFRNNRVSGYTIRGLWTMSNTDDVVFEGNTVFHCADIGIDLDGAGRPVRRVRVVGNTVYDIYKEGSGIELEDAFEALVERNLIHDVAGEGIESINYGLTTWDGKPGGTDKEYRTTDTKTVLRDNVIYAADKGGIVGYSSPGLSVYHNTIYGTRNSKGYFAAVVMSSAGKPQKFYCANWKIKNNIIAASKGPALWIDAPSEGLPGLDLSHNLYWASPKKPTHYLKITDKTIPLEEFQKTTAQEQGSIFADPMFVDAENHNFRLRPGSPASGAGIGLTGPGAGAASQPSPTLPDIGALNFSTPQPPADAAQSRPTQGAFLLKGANCVGVNSFLPKAKSYIPDAWKIIKDLGLNVIVVTGGTEGDIAHWNMKRYPDEWAKHLDDFLKEADQNGIKVYFSSLGTKWGMLFGINPPGTVPADKYGQPTTIKEAKEMLDKLAGDNILKHNFLADPRVLGWRPSNENDIGIPEILQWNIELCDYIRSKGGKAWLSSPRVKKWHSGEAFAVTEPILKDHVDYLEVHIYAVDDFVACGKNYDKFKAIYKKQLKEEMLDGRKYFPLDKIILGEFGIWTGPGNDMGVNATFSDEDRKVYYSAVFDVVRECGIKNVVFHSLFQESGNTRDVFGVVKLDGKYFPYVADIIKANFKN